MEPNATLPINRVIPDVQRTFATHHHVVLSALPGAGKTTRVPLALLDEPWLDNRKIIVLEPRRLAARAVAAYMASILGEQVGQTVGYRTRMDTRVSSSTRLEVVTEGILTRVLQNDSSLTDYNLIIFDEYHERSLQADLGLALCLQTQEVLREDLRILVMSATLDCEAVSALLKHAPIITCTGKAFPVETHYLPRLSNTKLEVSIVACIKQALTDETGNILVFLPGAGEIRRVQQLLESSNLGTHIIIAPLYGNLHPKAQDQAIQPPPFGMRKVVLATSIAETSLTIEGIRVVIDSGLMRVPRFDHRSGMTKLSTVRVSKDSADQRCGRAGRVESGVCYRLWTAIEQQGLLQRSSPEILASDLLSLALELAAWGVTDPSTLTWLDPPPAAAFSQAQELLIRLGALDNRYRLTAHGKKMVSLPLHPRLAHMVLRAKEFGLERLACDIAAILNERDFLKTHSNEYCADLRLRIDVLQTAGQSKQDRTIDQATLQRILKVADQLRTLLKLPIKTQPRHPQSESTGLLLAFAYPDRIAQLQSQRGGYYRLANNTSAVLKEADTISTEEYIVITNLDGTKPHARIFLAAPITLEELEKHCPILFHDQDCIEWDDQESAVQARRQRRLGELVIEDSQLHNSESTLITTFLLQGIRKNGINCFPWTKELRNWQARVEYVRRIEGEDSDWPDTSDHHLMETLELWLAPYLTGMSRLADVKRMNLHIPLHALLTWKQQQSLDKKAPTHITVPTGSRITLDYCAQDIPILAVRLQEMFGQQDTPKLAEGKGQVLLHLLSPARRPIQVTQDLASFWKNSYQEVKKELKGRYPKHYWPDNPLQAQPTRRIKPKP